MVKDELITILEMTTKYSYEYLKSLTVEKLQGMYEERQ
jgi:hypothetical protein